VAELEGCARGCRGREPAETYYDLLLPPKPKHLPRSILEMPNLSRGCRELLALEFDLSWLQPDDADLAAQL